MHKELEKMNVKIADQNKEMIKFWDRMVDETIQAMQSWENYIILKQHIFYYSSYWQKWDEILGYDNKNESIVVKEVGSNDIRKHCTSMEKNMLSTVVVDKNSFESYNSFKAFMKKESNKAWIIWRDSGIPRRLLKFEYK